MMCKEVVWCEVAWGRQAEIAEDGVRGWNGLGQWPSAGSPKTVKCMPSALRLKSTCSFSPALLRVIFIFIILFSFKVQYILLSTLFSTRRPALLLLRAEEMRLFQSRHRQSKEGLHLRPLGIQRRCRPDSDRHLQRRLSTSCWQYLQVGSCHNRKNHFRKPDDLDGPRGHPLRHPHS